MPIIEKIIAKYEKTITIIMNSISQYLNNFEIKIIVDSFKNIFYNNNSE